MTIKPVKKQNQQNNNINNNDENKMQHDNGVAGGGGVVGGGGGGGVGGSVVVVNNVTQQQTRNNRVVNCLNHNHVVGVQQNHQNLIQNNVQRGEKRNIGQVYDDSIHNRLHSRRQQTNNTNNLRTINKKRDQQQQQQQHYNHNDNQNINNNNILNNDNNNSNNNINLNNNNNNIINDNNNILPLNGCNNNINNNHNNVVTAINDGCSNNNNNNNNLINNHNPSINNNNNSVIVNTNNTNIVVLPGCSNNNNNLNINNNIDDDNNDNDEHDIITGYNSGDEHISKREDILTQNEWQERDKEFMKSMLKCGLIVKEIAEDGACLFRAISLQIYGDEDMHENIRKQTMDYIYQNREYFAQFVTEDINQYINRKRELSAHGNHIEIQAISELYNRPILLYCYKTDPYNIFNSEQLNNGYDPLRLSYQRCSHYNAIIDPYKSSVGVGLGLAGYCPDEFQHKDLNDAVLLSEQIEIEQTMFEDKLKTTDWEETNKVIEEEIARESYREYYCDSLKRSSISSTITSSSSAKIIDKQEQQQQQQQSTNSQLLKINNDNINMSNNNNKQKNLEIDNISVVAGCSSGLTAGPSGLSHKIYQKHNNKNYQKSSKNLLKKKLNHRGFIKNFSKRFDTINAKKNFSTRITTTPSQLSPPPPQSALPPPTQSTKTILTKKLSSNVGGTSSILLGTSPTTQTTIGTTVIKTPTVTTVLPTTNIQQNDDKTSYNYIHKIRKNSNIYKMKNNDLKQQQQHTKMTTLNETTINNTTTTTTITTAQTSPRIRIVPLKTLQSDNNNTQTTINNTTGISSFYQSLLDSAYYNNSDEIGTEENMIQRALEESRRSYLESLKVNCLLSGANIGDEDDSSSP